GNTLWSMPSHRDPRDVNAIFDLDPTGTIFVLFHPGAASCTWLRLPGREWIGNQARAASVLAPGGNRWFSLRTDPATQNGEWHYFPYGATGTEIAIAEQESVPGRLVFGPDGRQVAWGGSDYAVVVCDLTELQRAMAAFRLGW